MSYGIDLFFVPLSYTFDEALDNLDEGTLPESDLSIDAKRRRNWSIVRSLLAKNSSLKLFPQEIARQLAQSGNELEETLTNLSDNLQLRSENGMTIYIFPDQASITVPYWYTGSGAKEIFVQLRDYLQIIQEQSGYSICDPQLNKFVDLGSDFEAMLAAYCES